MKKKLEISFFVLLIIMTFNIEIHANDSLDGVRSWLCFYGGKLPEGIPKYDLYILSGSDHPDLAPLKQDGGKTIGYVSIGEIFKDDSLFAETKGRKLLVDENENWPGAFRVMIGSKKWHELVLDKLIPRVLAEGFDGIFLDTVDTAAYLENDKGIKGQIDGATQLIKKIRDRYPSIVIVLNNGLFMASNVGKNIDALVVEDIYTLYDFKNKKYQLATQKWTEERLIYAKNFQKESKKSVLSLDYLKKSDKKLIKTVENAAVGEGFVPYITDINLETIFYHP